MRRLALLALLLVPKFMDSSGGSVSIAPAAQRGETFAMLTVTVEPEAGAALGSYQVELILSHPAGEPKLAGVSGGEGLFSDPPAYDPAALHSGAADRVAPDRTERIVLADFSTAEPVPGAVTVARLDVMLPNGAADELRVETRLIAAGDGRAEPIAATVKTTLTTPSGANPAG